MAKSLVDVCKQLQAVAGGLPGIETAPDFPKESVSVQSFSFSYPETGSMDTDTLPATRGIHDVNTMIGFRNADLAVVSEKATPMVEAFAKAILADPTLAGTCDTIVGPVTYKFGRIPWGGKMEEFIGIKFTVKVKIRATS